MGTSVLRTGFRQTGANFIRAFTPGVLPSPQFQHLKAFPVRLQVDLFTSDQLSLFLVTGDTWRSMANGALPLHLKYKRHLEDLIYDCRSEW